MTRDECYIGARIVLNIDNPEENSRLFCGDEGNIVYIGIQRDDDELRIGVEWDKNGIGHNCDGKTAKGRGWYIYAKQASLAIEKGEENICVDSSLIGDFFI